MSNRFPPVPANTAPLLTARPSADARRLLALRRSTSKRTLRAPGPSPTDLDEILRVAARVPDHRKLEPWRFIVFEGDARAAFGAKLADIRRAEMPDTPQKELDEDAARLLRAPVCVTIVSSPVEDGRTPIWEQELSAGAVCQNLLLAANASGWSGVWLTEWVSYSGGVKAALGLSEHERIAGMMYLGTSTAAAPERPRPDMAAKVTRWQG